MRSHLIVETTPRRLRLGLLLSALLLPAVLGTTLLGGVSSAQAATPSSAAASVAVSNGRVDAARASAASTAAVPATKTAKAGKTAKKALVPHKLRIASFSRPKRTVGWVSPAAGALVGGTKIAVHGTGFTRQSVVKIGAARATKTSFRSAHELVAVVPAETKGSRAITVYTAGKRHSVWRGGSTRVVLTRSVLPPKQGAPTFTYLAQPVVKSVAATTLIAGARVTVTGTGFQQVKAVYLGTVAATKIVVGSAQKLTVTVPAAAAGEGNVTVVTAGGASSHPLDHASGGVLDGIYDWWSGPTAVSDGNITWLSSISSTGTIQLTRFNAITGSTRTVALGRTTADEHSTPSILFSPDHSSLLVFWTGHRSYSTISFRPVDRTTMAAGATRKLGFDNDLTYVQFIQHGNTVSVITRIGSSNWGIRVSRDFGRSWGAEGRFLDAAHGQTYVLLRRHGDSDSYSFAIYGNPLSDDHTIYYGELDGASGAVTNGSGTVLGNIYAPGGPALSTAHLDTAHTPPSGDNVRLLDVGLLGGQPAVLYAEWRTSDDRADYQLAVKGSGGWRVTPWTVAAGAPAGYNPAVNYVGGATFDGNGALYTSREVGGRWLLEKWAWNGSTVNPVDGNPLMDSAYPLLRPVTALGSGGRDVFVAVADRYTDYRHYHATIVRAPTQ